VFLIAALNNLAQTLEGDLLKDDLTKRLYATDASVYRKVPLAVVLPKTSADLQRLVAFATEHSVGLIPRTAGTSLAGQCVGEGIIVDFSRYFTNILHFDKKARTVTVQPGVVRDELNNFLKPYGLFFGPNTSTSNRCMIGGMFGNNSSGTTSIKYGVTRDKIVAVNTILSDGSEVEFKALEKSEVTSKLSAQNLEGRIYQTLLEELSSKEVQEGIKKEFPKPEIHRRNNGYAIDHLIQSNHFSTEGPALNLGQLLCGSEGTLAFATSITLKLDPLPPAEEALVALHFDSIEASLKSVKVLMTHDLYSCEMMDDTILDLTKHNKTQQENRNFIKGAPKAILLCELRSNDEKGLLKAIHGLMSSIEQMQLSYAAPVLRGEDITKAMELRKAGLGLLGNMVGDKKAVACIEDTAVALEDLAAYITEFSELMDSYGQKAVYYAHAGAGELHLRPILDLKSKDDVQLFRSITSEVSNLVKKYNGAMSGEHGDGIVRSEFIEVMIGSKNYEILKRIKQTFDPHRIFNPGKI
jgi:FAD/FMN-containing dehydrogenase